MIDSSSSSHARDERAGFRDGRAVSAAARGALLDVQQLRVVRRTSRRRDDETITDVPTEAAASTEEAAALLERIAEVLAA